MFYAWIHHLIKDCEHEVDCYTRGFELLAKAYSRNNPNKMQIIFWYNPQPRSRLNDK